ncbi:arylamine N-acetyltransferase family protein [Acetivibrio straminisolvens]|jgi:N-hydroxyarylamine O-acetyltransferase|uniref:arylamine N-acetyltransferase family protein n=1 Tax=Acetivibrio straminisolvens TaxID=253314 RepID=UPI00223F951C|nr:arylamine N-acetyltransferase [Acetivibrio straminisolvens]
MAGNELNLEACLHRIKYSGKIDVSADTLQGLHICYTTNVPFENLDIIRGKEILLDNKSLFKKIVLRKRGGCCFEMNFFFEFILKSLGFKVRSLLGRPITDNEQVNAKIHQLLLVEIGDKNWLADVGFGGNGLIAPIPFEEGIVQNQFTETFRLTRDEKFGYILQHKRLEEYRSLYSFTLEETYPSDYLVANYFCSKSPYSIFTRKKICTKPTPEGRITLMGKELKIRQNGEVTKTVIEDDKEYDRVLKDYFDLTVND